MLTSDRYITPSNNTIFVASIAWLVIIIPLVLIGCANQTAVSPDEADTATGQSIISETLASTREQAGSASSEPLTASLSQDAVLYAGPGNVDYESVEQLRQGDIVHTRGRFGDFVRVRTCNGREGYVWSGALEGLSPDTPVIQVDQLPWETVNLKRFLYNLNLRWDTGPLFVDNLDNNSWIGGSAGPISLHSEFEVLVNLSSNGGTGGFSFYGTSPPFAYDGQAELVIRPGDPILLINTDTNEMISLPIIVPESEEIRIGFADAEGTELIYLNEHIDLVESLHSLGLQQSLFPNRELYFDFQVPPDTTLSVSSLLLSQQPSGVYHPSADERCALVVGEQEMVLSRAGLESVGLHYWPDGVMGVLTDGDTYQFVAGNSMIPGITNGTLDNPIQNSVIPGSPIRGMGAVFQYASGGPIYQHSSGMLLMVYHAETWQQGIGANFGSHLGMAKSMDNGRTWTDLGLIISPQHPEFLYYPVDITSGPIVEAGDYFYIYFHDTIVENGIRRDIGLAVARARVQDVITAALESGTTTEWHKFFRGEWGQPGLSGYSSPLERGNPPSGAFDIAFDETLQRFVGIISTQVASSVNLYFIESPDGIYWTARRPIDTTTDRYSVYPTIVGLGANPSAPEGEFYVYYVDAPTWFWEMSNNFESAPLVRRLISCEDPDA